MAQLLLEDYASKRNKILKNPKFLDLYGKYTQGIFGGTRSLSKETFIDNIAKAFDPTYNVTVNAQTNALNGDSSYLDFIFANLYSGNISPDQSNAAREALGAYQKEKARNNPQISKDIQSFKVFYPDDSVKGRDGEPLPGLINTMEAYTRKYDFEGTIHSNLQKTLAAFQENNIDEVYANSVYKFFRIDTTDAAKILLGNREPMYDPDFFTSGRSERCSGYWCLPRMPGYYPCWVAVDVYGFMDYAIVPKPEHNYSAAEIKNRFNHTDSVCKMTPASYAAILDFFLSHGDQEPMIVDGFKLSFERIGKGNALIKYGTTLSYEYSYDDCVKFLLRSPTLDVVHRLTNERCTSNLMFAAKMCGVASDKMVSEAVYQEKMGLGLSSLHNYYPGKKVDAFAPLFKSIEHMHNTSLVDTNFSFEKYAAQFIPSLIDSFKQSFPQDTDLLDEDAKGLKTLYKFIDETLPVIHAYRPELAKKIAMQITKLIQEDRLYFDATTNIDELVSASKLIKFLKTTVRKPNRQFEQYASMVQAIEDSFGYYMSMGGAFNWKDPQGHVATNPALLDNFAEYIENSTAENKQKLFDLYAQSITNRLISRNAQGAEINAATIAGLFDVAAKLNLPRETSIKKIVEAFDKSILQKPSSMLTNSIRMMMANDEIATYINRNKKYINKVAPHFAQLLAIIDPTSDFGAMYPKIAKLKLSQKYILADKRREFYRELKALANNELIAGRPELAFGDNIGVRNSFGRTFMVPASTDNIQKMISLRGNGYNAAEFQQMLPNFAMLINAGFKPQKLFINFGEYDMMGVETEMRNKGFKLGGRTLIKGDFDGKPVGIGASGLIYYVDGNLLKTTNSFEEFQQHQQQALFDHYKIKPKHGFHGLYERVNCFAAE